ncbi:16S rRNA (guanine(966)-N(2))-methyltransferase RsmD [Actinomyces ruminicola]|uniref:16S rRNA (guanine(966)-N(2))-methyltransferase RsmD n=1 Tax=Actinomyces ruminicola TaxID=332524 RepID=UPI0011C8283F|nr:16S rRNA (guanine(966)-N(2))-methyltransferase RsmD [Actinomyces ruminicola]
MTRIVAGSAGGRRIDVPAAGTRPTSERVREALFGRLEHYGVIADARVLDLCAGSGALGLEAASRGATDVTLVDASRRATRVCDANIRALGLRGVRSATAKVEAFLAGPAGAPVDLVMLDPPYDVDEATLAAMLAPLPRRQDPWLAPDAVVVVERSSRSPEPSWPAGLRRFSTRKYGETTLWFAEPDDGAPSNDDGAAADAEPAAH